MLKLQNLSLPLDYGEAELRKKAAAALRVSPAALGEVRLLRRSVDARKKNDVHFVCTLGVTVENETALLQRRHDANITLFSPRPYVFPGVKRTSPLPPVVVGMGPAGLFSALFLARNGIPCVVLERGRDVDARTGDVEHFLENRAALPRLQCAVWRGWRGHFLRR